MKTADVVFEILPSRTSVAAVPLAMLNSPAMRVIGLTAHRVLQRILIGIDAGCCAITHRQFVAYGCARDSITHAIAELEALGLIRVGRSEAKASCYHLAEGYRDIATLAAARRIRDQARHFGITRRRKVERATRRRLTEARRQP